MSVHLVEVGAGERSLYHSPVGGTTSFGNKVVVVLNVPCLVNSLFLHRPQISSVWCESKRRDFAVMTAIENFMITSVSTFSCFRCSFSIITELSHAEERAVDQSSGLHVMSG